MIVIPSLKTKKVHASPNTTIWEFVMEEKAISGAVAQINLRYPEKGFAVNQKSKELAFVISGSGLVVTPKERRTIGIGDFIFLDAGESFAWEGALTIFMATSPAFDPKQHVITKNNE